MGHSKSAFKIPSDAQLSTSRRCIGGDILLQLLKNYSRSLDLKQSISVGVIGYPNVGKSSIINSLKRSKAAGTSSTPGHTKTLQEIHLDKNITLIDSPGVIFSENDNASLALRNSLKIEQIDSPINVVEALLNRCSMENLVEIYEIPLFKDCDEFLFHIASKHGHFKKGGVPDLQTAARTVLRNWNNGKIIYYCEPPEIFDQKSNSNEEGMHDTAEIVSS